MGPALDDDAARWNHNIHYHRLVVEALPDHAQRTLDIGCGEGMLARQLRKQVPDVVGIDLDRASIDLAEAQDEAGRITYICDDFLTCPFEPASFDFIATVATLHHVDARVGLARTRELLRPGGTLCVVGLARSTLRDLPRTVGGVIEHRWLRHAKGYWEHPSPTVWPPPETYAGMQRIAEALLPGVRFRRHVLFRYSLIWSKPL